MIKENYYFYMPHMYDKTNFIKRTKYYIYFFFYLWISVCTLYILHTYVHKYKDMLVVFFFLFVVDIPTWYGVKVCVSYRYIDLIYNSQKGIYQINGKFLLKLQRIEKCV